MRAMVLETIGAIETAPLRPAQAPDPAPGEGQVRVKVRCCAVCRTDLHIIEGDIDVPRLPIIPGHQVVGVVDRIGPGCTRWKIGDRLGIAWLRHTCGRCPFCTTGRENLCPYSQYTGYHADGGYAEYAIVSEAYAYAVPAGFDDIDAAPLLCAGIIGYRALLRTCLDKGRPIALIGFGSSAHIVLQLARHRGSDVYVVSRGHSHQQLAHQMGAVWVGSQMERMPATVSGAILFAPAGELVPPILQKLDRGGTLALAGIHMSPIPSLDYDKLLFGERDIHPVTANTREDGRNLLKEAAEAGVRPHTVRYPLAEANRALADMKADRIDGTGVLMMDD